MMDRMEPRTHSDACVRHHFANNSISAGSFIQQRASADEHSTRENGSSFDSSDGKCDSSSIGTVQAPVLSQMMCCNLVDFAAHERVPRRSDEHTSGCLKSILDLQPHEAVCFISPLATSRRANPDDTAGSKHQAVVEACAYATTWCKNGRLRLDGLPMPVPG